jgi:HlyD family secretion protein
MSKSGWKKRLAAGVVVAILAGGSIFVWRQLKPASLPDSFAIGNGRIEATEIDIATKTAGRITEILVNDGDVIEAGQVLARMDTQTLEAELRQAQAQVRQAQQAKATATAIVAQRASTKATATAIVAQRASAKATATAIVAQRESELALADKELTRSQQLAFKGAGSQQQLDTDYTKYKSTTAALSAAQSQLLEAQSAIAAAKAQVAEAQAAIEAAQSQVVEAQATLEAALATTERLKAELEDSILKAPRSGRVQYRMAQPGEVLPAGGKILTLLDLSDVYMTFFLPETLAGRVAIGAETRVVLDAAPHYVFPAHVSFVASVAQFTPKTVETTTERQKLVFRVKAQGDPEVLKRYGARVKTGLPGVATVRLDPTAAWPAHLQVRLAP